MKKIIVLLIAVFIISPLLLNSQDLNLKKVLKNHYKVMKYKELSEVNSILIEGKVIAQGMEMDFTQKIKRPDKIRTEVLVQGNQMVQAVNGDDGWMIIPWTGSTDPQDMPEEQKMQLKEQTDMEGDLWNWEEKAANVELEGTEDMDGKEVYKIKVTKHLKEGEKEGVDEPEIRYYYLDCETFVISKIFVKRMMGGSETEVETTQSDYKEEEGFMVAHKIESKVGGVIVSQVEIDSYKLNVDIDDAVFERPTNE